LNKNLNDVFKKHKSLESTKTLDTNRRKILISRMLFTRAIHTFILSALDCGILHIQSPDFFRGDIPPSVSNFRLARQRFHCSCFECSLLRASSGYVGHVSIFDPLKRICAYSLDAVRVYRNFETLRATSTYFRALASSSVSFSIFVFRIMTCRTRLSAVGDRAFPVAA